MFEGSTSVQMIGSWINSISIPRERCTISRLLHQRQPFLSNFAPEFSIGYFLVGYFSTGYFALWVIESIFGGEQIDGVALTRFIRPLVSPIADMKHTCTAWNSWLENQQIKVVIASQFLNWVKKNQAMEAAKSIWISLSNVWSASNRQAPCINKINWSPQILD